MPRNPETTVGKQEAIQDHGNALHSVHAVSNGYSTRHQMSAARAFASARLNNEYPVSMSWCARLFAR
jgi:hypothetical protein